MRVVPSGLGGIKGKVITPGDPEYNEARQEWNRRIQKFPRAIVYCENRQDVSKSVEWARRRGAPIRLRGGGHHYEGYSTGNGALVIDVSRMDRVTVEGDLVRAEGGVSNRALYNALGPLGYAFPSGTCPTVCVSGLTQGGGWGLSCRLLGLTCDSLVSAEMVDACGRIVTANAHCNQDLYWALRGGGGGSFGVMTGLVYRLPTLKPEVVTFIQLYYPDTGMAAQTRFWETWQSWLADADERVTLQASIYHAVDEGFAVYSRGLFFGTPEEAMTAVEPLAALPGCETSFEGTTFYDAIQTIENSYPPYEKFKSTGRFVARPFANGEIRRMVESLRDYPEGSVFTSYSLYALGGAVAAKRPGETAFFYRDAPYITLLQSVWEQDQFEQDNIAWVDRYFPYLASLTAGSYVNFPYSGLKDYMRAYYGGNAGRLHRVKRMYDPCNVFCFPQCIRP
jgi:FAD/FMN-containing dehydrogenase